MAGEGCGLGCGREHGMGVGVTRSLTTQIKTTLKVLNHASRTLPRLPYTNLKKSRTEKNTGY